MYKILALIAICVLLGSCVTPEEPNPFLKDYDTPFKVPPFDQITEEHYMPAIQEGITRHKAEIQAIISSADEPTFQDTVEALERSGELLAKVTRVFFNLNAAHTNDAMQALARDVAPLLSEHQDSVLLNQDLFDRIKKVYEIKETLGLTKEQMKLLDEQYKEFVRGGANLNPEQKVRLTEINKELSLLIVQFGENVLKENNRFEMVLENEQDLAGLPGDVVTAAAEAAEERGHEGKWVFTLHKPSLIPFLQYSEKRDLREKMLKGYIERGDHDDELDNKEILSRIVDLRIKKAKLMGYETYAHFVLEENMAKEPGKVYDLLNKIWKPALARAGEEARILQTMIKKDGHSFKLQPWDWWFYAEKLKKEKYDLDDEVLKPYFKLENVRKGAFDVAGKLWGITFEERTDVPVYHPDVKVFEVKEADGSSIGLLMTDYFPRESKRGGAWMDVFVKQSHLDGKRVAPVIYNVGNFAKQPDNIASDCIRITFCGQFKLKFFIHISYTCLPGNQKC